MSKLSNIKEGIANGRELCENFEDEFDAIADLRLGKEYLYIEVSNTDYGNYFQQDIFLSWEDSKKAYIEWLSSKKKDKALTRHAVLLERKKRDFQIYLNVKNNLSEYENIQD